MTEPSQGLHTTSRAIRATATQLNQAQTPDPQKLKNSVTTVYRAAEDVPGGLVVKNPPSNAGDAGSIPGWGAKILRYCCSDAKTLKAGTEC